MYAMKRTGAKRIRIGRSARLSLRASTRQSKLIRAAADAQGRSVTDFILEIATKAAEDVLATRSDFVLPRDQWAAFVSALDRPVRRKPRLERLFAESSVLDRKR